MKLNFKKGIWFCTLDVADKIEGKSVRQLKKCVFKKAIIRIIKSQKKCKFCFSLFFINIIFIFLCVGNVKRPFHLKKIKSEKTIPITIVAAIKALLKVVAYNNKNTKERDAFTS